MIGYEEFKRIRDEQCASSLANDPAELMVWLAAQGFEFEAIAKMAAEHDVLLEHMVEAHGFPRDTAPLVLFCSGFEIGVHAERLRTGQTTVPA